MAKRANLILVSMLVLSLASGCCTKSRKKPDSGPGKIKKNLMANSGGSKTGRLTPVDRSTSDELQTDDPQVNEIRRRKTEQYRSLEYAHQMLTRNNAVGALRELERLQMDIREDPYLEMQSWYLSAMVYHKLGKPSRRKRSMRKMLDTMEQLQKDARFRSAFEDGKFSQEMIEKAKKDAGEKYDKFAD